ncbi:rhomboid family intramembrane serine protease [candidate division WOR-3 bacterium]|nr:rhomboid family intramembrane serine protease [candidate division WOR-3 bacterium]
MNSFGPVTKGFLFLCVIVFIAQIFLGQEAGLNFLALKFGLIPLKVWKSFEVWRLATYNFIHGGFFHLFLNLFVFWMFGTELENRWGSFEFLIYIAIGGFGAGLLHVVVSYKSLIPVIGSSGIVFALLLAYGLEFPNRKLYLYFLFPIKAKYLALLLGVVEILMIFSDNSSNIAHLAHLGGMVFGLAYLKVFKRQKPSSRQSYYNVPYRVFNQDEKSIKTGGLIKFYDDETIKRELDRILEKINYQGKDSLTVEEIMILKEAGRRFNRNYS